MSTEALEKLTTELGARPPESLTQLTPEQLALLTDALRRERESRASGLNQAAEEALKLVPALARGPVRRILFR
ncbi:hypothetical protein ABT390_15280 [Streptomyces aurantiacus]|uniref:Uncharacterized protein n=1 Tax=Streptomyces aurantiacus JA 4570 TaxID=1286094 RepID=S3ZLV5_9ACTN|nr:hypothetical protein [Streptomyces aurantiacus]EPH44501.1 hypothetical protein STRAU_2420 [Streptomyces aurantiacus JA 4570]